MGTETIEASFLSIFALISFFIFLLTSKFSHKFRNGVLFDQNFEKPQAFHEIPITRSGGVGSIIALFVFFGIYYLLYSEILYDYLILSLSMFLVGFLDDLKLNIKPSKRLLIMIILIFTSVYLLPIKINNIEIPYLKFLLTNNLFSSIFVLVCFLFIINGANLVDGFNGLLTIHLIIINIILTYVNLGNSNLEFSFLLVSQIIILLSFLLFNFPKAKIFLGDSGAYLFGSLTSLNVIFTNNLNPKISSFFFCILLFYLFFEVFFSFFRKIIEKKSPIYPDERHLHMLCYYKISAIYGKNKANFLNALLVNLIYLILIIPGLYFYENSMLSRLWFFILLITYVFIYLRIYRLTKN